MSPLILALVLAATPVPGGTATVPLDQLVPLLAQKAPAEAAQPPVDALVVHAQLEGRLGADALNLTARFQVNVLADGRWTQVPLLELGPDAYLTTLPALEGASVALVDGRACLLTRSAGSYSFELGVAVRAAVAQGERRVALRAGPSGARVPLKLEVDPAFTLVDPKVSGAQLELFPRDGEWLVRWTGASASPRVERAARAPLEPRVLEAAATWVSTLEGRLSAQVRYALQLDRPQPIEFELPSGYRLDRAVINGVPVAPADEKRTLALTAAPSSVGESAGVIELQLSRELGVFHLSGEVELALPRASWPIAELSGRAHLPAVFNYRREGGSMEQVEDAPAPAGAGAPLPGKVLAFRQFLVARSIPNVELGYSVDIENSYFR